MAADADAVPVVTQALEAAARRWPGREVVEVTDWSKPLTNEGPVAVRFRGGATRFFQGGLWWPNAD